MRRVHLQQVLQEVKQRQLTTLAKVVLIQQYEQHMLDVAAFTPSNQN